MRVAMRVVGVALIACALALLGCIFMQKEAATSYDYSPKTQDVEDAVNNESPFPIIDWEAWQAVNPAVIGWVTVPETEIDYPILSEAGVASGYWLNHDINGNWNLYGVPYLSGECDAGLTDSSIALIYGHHMRDGSMFADFASYLTADYAAEHSTIYLQTPSKQLTLTPIAVDRVNANTEEAAVSFSSTEALQTWLSSLLATADLALIGEDEVSQIDQVYAFCTCSYSVFKNERTIVYCAAAQD